MQVSQADSPCRLLLRASADCRLLSISGFLFSLLLAPLSVIPAHAQDTGTAATEFYGKGTAVRITIRDPSGQPISSSAIVKLFRGTIPAGQGETNNGRAELVVFDLGEFTVVVNAAGYASAQQDFYINAAGETAVDVSLHALSGNASNVAGRPVLAPKAKKAVSEAFEALGADNLAQAQKHASEAVRLAPGHPDVLYLQGIIFLKQRDWSKAQDVFEKATQEDPSHAGAFSALGMTLCDEGKYEAAVEPLEKALQFNPAATSWDTRWALAKAYYHLARYDQALQMSEAALASSNGKAPEIQLLVAQSLTAVGRYDDAARQLREFLRNHSDRHEAATARRWLEGLAANGKIHRN